MMVTIGHGQRVCCRINILVVVTSDNQPQINGGLLRSLGHPFIGVWTTKVLTKLGQGRMVGRWRQSIAAIGSSSAVQSEEQGSSDLELHVAYISDGNGVSVTVLLSGVSRVHSMMNTRDDLFPDRDQERKKKA